jgi:hypothetical protein
MKITALTATFERPDAMRLCEKYLKRQTRQPDQWLVLDGPEPMPAKVLAAIEAGRIEGDVLVWFEDDDFYRADWIEWLEGGFKRGYDLIGEGHACYYNPRRRWWSECKNVRHAALAQTAVHRDLLENVANVIRCFHSPYFDTRIWPLDCNKFLALPNTPRDNRVIGIKGIYEGGYSDEHRAIMPDGAHADPSLMQLWKWIGKDAAAYLPFKQS